MSSTRTSRETATLSGETRRETTFSRKVSSGDPSPSSGETQVSTGMSRGLSGESTNSRKRATGETNTTSTTQ